tara:strand:- start:5073 stop:5258 length:186 start_codon:yes stop_codon:yes gene_type:complete
MCQYRKFDRLTEAFLRDPEIMAEMPVELMREVCESQSLDVEGTYMRVQELLVEYGHLPRER